MTRSTGIIVALTNGRFPFTITIELDGDLQPWQIGDEVDLLTATSDEAQRIEEIHEAGYVAGAVAQWKRLARQAVSELRSYGIVAAYRELDEKP